MNTPQTEKSYAQIAWEAVCDRCPWEDLNPRSKEYIEKEVQVVISTYRSRMKEGHRLLAVGEVIQEGDEYASAMRLDNGELLAWMPSNRVGRKVAHVNCAVRRRCLVDDGPRPFTSSEETVSGWVKTDKGVEPLHPGYDAESTQAQIISTLQERVKFLEARHGGLFADAEMLQTRIQNQCQTIVSLRAELDASKSQSTKGPQSHVGETGPEGPPSDPLEHIKWLEGKLKKCRAEADNYRDVLVKLDPKPQSPETSPWIPLSEKSPEFGKLCAFLKCGGGFPIVACRTQDLPNTQQWTHWMLLEPLPQPKDAFTDWLSRTGRNHLSESDKAKMQDAWRSATQHATQKP